MPVIVERAEKAEKSIPDIDKKKYLVPSDLTVGQFVYVIRKRIKLSPEKAIFIFIDNRLPVRTPPFSSHRSLLTRFTLLNIQASASLMSTVYEELRDKDGFLYIKYSGENTFGTDAVDLEMQEEVSL